MKLGKIVGKVVTSDTLENFNKQQFSMVEELNKDLEATGNLIVAADLVNSGENDLVLYAAGSSATNSSITTGCPIDHVVVAIVDTVYVNNEIVYK